MKEMTIKILKMKFIIAALFLINTLQSCVKLDDCPRYFFISAFIEPLKKDYKIGDTITIISKFHRNVPALNSEETAIRTFDMKGINWKPVTQIHRLDTTGGESTPVVGQCFNFIKDSSFNYSLFYYSEGGSDIGGEYNYSNDSFNLKIKIQCQKIGSFILRHSSWNFINRGQQDFPGRCEGHGYTMWTRMNGGSINNHLELLEQSPNPFFSVAMFGNPNYNFHNFGGYCFNVIP